MRTQWKPGLALGTFLAMAGCGGDGPTAPTAFQTPATKTQPVAAQQGFWEADGAVAATHHPNSSPNLVLRTHPASVPGDPYAVVSGQAPLTVRFNLCPSSDPDQAPDGQPTAGEGDTLNWQFHFGDDGSDAFHPDGSFNASSSGFCRVEHTYHSAGRYVATVSVTDKHLEDQSGGVSAFARDTERVTIDVSPAGGGSKSSGTGGSFSFESANVPLAVPPTGTFGTTVDALTAAGVSGAISDLDVSLHITHTWDSDLVISLTGPDGTTVNLANRRGSSGDNYGTSCAARTTFDDEAATPISGGAAPFAGAFVPESPLAAFDGKTGAAVNGTWTLTVDDQANQDAGALQCWGIAMTTS